MKSYHEHVCRKCHKAIIKPGPWAVCKRKEAYDECSEHLESCWTPVSNMSPKAQSSGSVGVSGVPSVEGRGGAGLTDDEKVWPVEGLCRNGKCMVSGNRCNPGGFCYGCCLVRHANKQCSRVVGWKPPAETTTEEEYNPTEATLVAEETF